MTYYLAISTEQDGKFAAHAARITGADNLVHCLPAGTVAANVCQSRKEAESIAAAWNKTYFDQGVYRYA